MKKTFRLLMMTGILLSGCTSIKVIENPEIINHQEPKFDQKASETALAEMGCVSDGSEGNWDCPSESKMGKLGCEHIGIDERLGGFTPAYSIWQCFNQNRNSNDNFMALSSCNEWPLVYYSMGFVIGKDDNYRLLGITDITDLQIALAPIDSANEALSFLLLAVQIYVPLDGAWPEFHIDRSLNPVFHSEQIEGTHTEESTDGYRINLFTGIDCGCENFDIFSINILVTRGGEIKIINQELLYTTDFVCVD